MRYVKAEYKRENIEANDIILASSDRIDSSLVIEKISEIKAQFGLSASDIFGSK